MESALRHYVHSFDDPARWTDAISRLQFELNNTKSASTGKAPAFNQIVDLTQSDDVVIGSPIVLTTPSACSQRTVPR